MDADSSSLSGLAYHQKADRCQELLRLSNFISDVFLRPDVLFDSWLAGPAVKAERSEFIWSLEGRRSQP
jgi:hypothetical protein